MAYFSDHQDKRLHEIVFPGSHDAGITTGGGNAKTQSLGILGQANAGCRDFDIRVLEHDVGSGANKTREYDTYHAQFLPKTKKTKRPRKLAGTYGTALDRILDDCLDFLDNFPDEFLILRFSKCSGWIGIANKVITTLGDRHYKPFGNLNITTAGDLAGTVVTVFDDPARKYLARHFGPGTGILYVKSLVENTKAHWYSSKVTNVGAYDPEYNGLQYFGKFGATTTVGALNPRTASAQDAKIAANVKKQLKNLNVGAAAPPQVLGMMYWTSTGVFQNIIARNDRMWQGVHSGALKEVWSHGLYESMAQRASHLINFPQLAGVNATPRMLKSFMPNIVMIDDVNAARCNTIWGLNDVAEEHPQLSVNAMQAGL